MSSAPPDPEAGIPPEEEPTAVPEQRESESALEEAAEESGGQQEEDAAPQLAESADSESVDATPPVEDAAVESGGAEELAADSATDEGEVESAGESPESAELPVPGGERPPDSQEKTEGLDDTGWLLHVAEAQATLEARRKGGAAAAEPGTGASAGKKVDARHPLARDVLLNPTSWKIWPAVAVLRWLLRGSAASARRLVYRSRPSLAFTPAEIEDVAFGEEGVDLVLFAPGLAAPGSPLPYSDIERIIHDRRKGGGLARFLDMSVDRFMHAMENSLVNSSSAFAYARGGRSTSLRMAASLAGLTAPLAAEPNGVLEDTRQHEEGGAAALISLFVGPISASGLAGCLRTVTDREVMIREFAGATVRVARPTRVGGTLSGLLGAKCFLREAGVEAIIRGDAETLRWVQDTQRRDSLYRLARAFIGSASPEVRIYLRVDANDVPPAALDGKAQLGGLAMLGEAEGQVLVQLSDPAKEKRIN